MSHPFHRFCISFSSPVIYNQEVLLIGSECSRRCGNEMDILMIGDRTFSVYISESELLSRNIAPAGVSISQAEDLVRGAIGCVHGTMMMDLFPGRHELLIFVHSDPDGPMFITFDDLEELLEASLSVSFSTASSLFLYEGKYILAVWNWTPDEAVSLLEFGHLLELPPEFLFHLREHGCVLLEPRALQTLKSIFSPA